MFKTLPRPGLKYLLFVFPLIISLGLLAQEVPVDEESINNGQTLFQQNCSPCHRIDSKLVGPALRGVYDRRDVSWVVSFIKNSQKVIASGDETAVSIYEEYNNLEMPAFDFFDDEQILDIISYIKAESEKAPEETEATQEGQPTQVEEQQPIASGYLKIILIGLVVVLALILVVLVLIVTVLKKYLSQKDLAEDEEDIVKGTISITEILKHRVTIGVVGFIFTALILKIVIDGLYNVGIQQDYAPTQPIAFSHQIHAGQFQIDCNYCHTGVMKSKNANIPSANICMNCHGEIKTGTNTGETEINKIYAAVENNTPIEWVRVHNLPDLAYFNHAQHVNVGNLECQTCHGPVEEMDVLRQHAPLTMGWCIDCHRQTEVNTRGNAYYDKLVELHDENKEPMKVEDIGGLECAKCHY